MNDYCTAVREQASQHYFWCDDPMLRRPYAWIFVFLYFGLPALWVSGYLYLPPASAILLPITMQALVTIAALALERDRRAIEASAYSHVPEPTSRDYSDEERPVTVVGSPGELAAFRKRWRSDAGSYRAHTIVRSSWLPRLIGLSLCGIGVYVAYASATGVRSHSLSWLTGAIATLCVIYVALSIPFLVGLAFGTRLTIDARRLHIERWIGMWLMHSRTLQLAGTKVEVRFDLHTAIFQPVSGPETRISLLDYWRPIRLGVELARARIATEALP